MFEFSPLSCSEVATALTHWSTRLLPVTPGLIDSLTCITHWWCRCQEEYLAKIALGFQKKVFHFTHRQVWVWNDRVYAITRCHLTRLLVSVLMTSLMVATTSNMLPAPLRLVDNCVHFKLLATPVDSTACRRLRSASSTDLVVPATRRSTVGDRAFAVAGPRAWNSLNSTQFMAAVKLD